jgi:2-oxoisovalerate dehydrogenase E2 component (dihydrolipoyl transacylase)
LKLETNTLTTISMPQLGESVTEGMVGNWLKQVGERVEKYDQLCEVTTDKVNSEIPSPVAGVLVEILVEPETTVPVGAGICRIDEAGEATEQSAVSTEASDVVLESKPAPLEAPVELDLLRARSSPVVRRIAEEHGIELAAVEGTGIGGRVTKRDILAHLETRPPQPPNDSAEIPAPSAPPSPPVAAPETTSRTDEPGPSRQPVVLEPGDEVVPLTPMRRAIAEHMVRSERTAPHVTTVMEVDMTGIVAYRAATKEAFARREGVELSYVPFVIEAVARALREHPRLNAAWDEDRIIHRGAIHIGLAVGLEDGLVVPVIRHADRLNLAGLAHAVTQAVEKARTGKLQPDDLAGGTFTVNNPGAFGSISSTPILVQPQVAILSMEAIVKRPVVVDDMIGVRSMMNLSLSIDHRALDGLAAARFLQAVKRQLETVAERRPLG